MLVLRAADRELVASLLLRGVGDVIVCHRGWPRTRTVHCLPARPLRYLQVLNLFASHRHVFQWQLVSPARVQLPIGSDAQHRDNQRSARQTNRFSPEDQIKPNQRSRTKFNIKDRPSSESVQEVLLCTNGFNILLLFFRQTIRKLRHLFRKCRAKANYSNANTVTDSSPTSISSNDTSLFTNHSRSPINAFGRDANNGLGPPSIWRDIWLLTPANVRSGATNVINDSPDQTNWRNTWSYTRETRFRWWKQKRWTPMRATLMTPMRLTGHY